MNAKKKDLINILISAIIFIVIAVFVKPTAVTDASGEIIKAGLTASGVKVLAILVCSIYMWLTIGVGWTCLFSIVAVAMTGATSFSNVVALSFGHFVVPLLISVSILNYALDKTGLSKRIATWFMTRKIVENRPWIFIILFFLSEYILGLFMETISVMMIYISLANALFVNLGYEKGDKFRKTIMLGILWVGAITFAATPISHAVPIILMGMLSASKITLSFLQYMSIGIPYSFAFFICSILVMKFIIKPDVTKLREYDINVFVENKTKMSKQEKIVAITFAAVIVLWLAPSFLKGVLPVLCNTVSSWGAFTPSFLGCILLFVIKPDKEPIIDYQQSLKQVPWSLIILTAAISMLSSVITLPSVGINTWLASLFAPLTSTLSLTAIIAVMIVFAVVLTNFMSNTIVVAIFYSILLPVVLSAGANASISVIAFAVLLSLAANTAIMTPLAGAYVSLAMSTGDLSVPENMKWSSVMAAVGIVLLLIVAWPLANVLL